MKKVILALYLVVQTTTLFAQEEQPAAPPSYDCSMVAAHQQFDFWLGDWEVRIADGRRAGSNTVTSVNGGCLLKEEWTNMQGSTGSSLNYYNSLSDKWTQNWVDAQTIINLSGGLENSSMVLTGTIYYQMAKREAELRGTWTPLEDGRVRQFFEEKDAEGNWQIWFEGFYSPVK